MTETPFFKTRMGQTYYERTVPELVKQIARLADAVERLIEQRDRKDDQE